MKRFVRVLSMLLALVMMVGLLPLSVMAEEAHVTHTVQFKLNYNGAKKIAAQTVADGECATEPEDATREGWILKGWYTKKNGGERFDFSAPITADVTLYAQWDEDIEYWGRIWGNNIVGMIEKGEKEGETTGTETYTVTFEANGEGVEGLPAAQTVKKGECAVMPTAPTRDGYTFEGWYSDKECLKVFDFSKKIFADYSLYAKWEENPYSIGLVRYIAATHAIEVYINGAVGFNINYYILDESQENVLFTRSHKLKKDNALTKATCYLNDFVLPEYFVIKITMTDSENNEVCDEYICFDYTEKYVEFFAKTIYDFDESQVVNLDEQIDNNFMVANSTVSIIRTDKITQVVYNEDTDAYEITGKINEIDFSTANDKIMLVWNDEIICFNINNAIISDEHIIINNFNEDDGIGYFDFIKIDTTKRSPDFEMQTYSVSGISDTDDVHANIEYDESEEVTSIDINGREEENYIKIWEPGTPIHFGFKDNQYDIGFEDDNEDNIEDSRTDIESFDLSAGIDIEPSIRVYIKVFYDVNWGSGDEITVKVGAKARCKISLALKFNDTHAFTDKTTKGTFSVPVTPDIPVISGIPGLKWYFGFAVPIEFSIKGEASASLDFSFDICQEYVNGQLMNPLSTDLDITPAISEKLSGELFAGLQATIGAYCGTNGKRIIDVNVNFKAGGTIKAELGIVKAFPPAKSIHECDLCFGVTLNPKIEFGMEATIKIFKAIISIKPKKEIKFKNLELKFYGSFINEDYSVHQGKVKFALGTCPNVTYRHKIKAYDSYNEKEYDIKLIGNYMCSDNKTVKEIPDDLEPRLEYYYLYNGSYIAYCSIDGKRYTREFDVDGKENSINILEYVVDGSVVREDSGGGLGDTNVTVYLENGNVIADFTTGKQTEKGYAAGMLDTKKTKFNIPVGYDTLCVKVEHDGYDPYETKFEIPNTFGILDLGIVKLKEHSEIEDMEGQTIRFLVDNEGVTDHINMRSLIGDETSGDAVSKAVFDRNKNVSDRLNMNIEIVGTDTSENMNDHIWASVVAYVDDFDVAETMYDTSYVLALDSGGLLVNVDKLTNIDQQASYWNSKFADNISISGKKFFVTGDLALQQNGAYYATYVNADIWNRVSGNANIYDMVDDGEWTLDTMARYIEITKTLSDGTKGLAIDRDSSIDAMATGAGARFSQIPFNAITDLIFENQHTYDVFDRLYSIIAENSGSVLYESDSVEDALAKFNDDGALFTVNTLNVASSAFDSVNYHILPMPKYDESYDHYTRMSNHITVFSVPITVTNEGRAYVSTALEALASGAYNTVTSVYSAQMLSKTYQPENARRMLRMITGSTISDLAAFYPYATSYAFADAFSKNYGYSVYETAQRKAWEQQYKKFIEAVEDIEDPFSR